VILHKFEQKSKILWTAHMFWYTHLKIQRFWMVFWKASLFQNNRRSRYWSAKLSSQFWHFMSLHAIDYSEEGPVMDFFLIWCTGIIICAAAMDYHCDFGSLCTIKKCKVENVTISHFRISWARNFKLSSDFWYHAVELGPRIRKKLVSGL
jgi:hypothetical protein